MNRIEEIKETLEKGRKYGLANDDGEGYVEDVAYLLSRLEIAEKALERYANLHKLMYDDGVDGELYEHWWLRQNSHAVEALQQIRE